MADTIEILNYTEEEFLREGGTVLHQVGVHSTYGIHSHNFYELFLVPKGRAVHVINGQTQLLQEGSFVLIRPNDVHCYDFFGNSEFEVINKGIPCATFAGICAYLQIDESRFTSSSLPPHLILSGERLSDVHRKLLHGNKIGANEAGYTYMRSIFPFLIQMFLYHPTEDALLPRWMSSLLVQMDSPENYIAGLERIVSLSNMSQEHLTRSFRRYIGLTPTEFINAKRLGMAAQQLLETDLPVIEISGRCGFNSLSRFYRLFTERYGCSPMKFRKNARNLSSQSL